MNALHLTSIQTGLPRTSGDPEKTSLFEKEWTTGFFKSPVEGPVEIQTNGICGDGQADLSVHGGPDKAVCCYPSRHFAYWKSELGIDMSPGAFGENFTLDQVGEEEVCIGDIFAADNVVFQISQPRQPCWKLARRWGEKSLTALVQKSGKTGWYFRVLSGGFLSAPAELTLRERIHPAWSITRANEVMHLRKNDTELTQELAGLTGLSESWRETLEKRIR